MRSALLCLICLFFSHLRADEGWTLTVGPALEVSGDAKKGKDISGAALLHKSGMGLLVSDETRAAQAFILEASAQRFALGEILPVLPGEGEELDAEALCVASDGMVYITGSHSVSRSDKSVKPDRQYLVRFDSQDRTKLETSRKLLSVLETIPEIKPSINAPLDQHGLDIEGLAERNGQLYFGLRSPCVASEAFIVEAKASDLFDATGTVKGVLHRLKLGDQTGIRDMARTESGFLILSGPESEAAEAAVRFQLFNWTGPDGVLIRIGELPSDRGKPEAISVISENQVEVTALLLLDGAKNGGPTLLEIKKP